MNSHLVKDFYKEKLELLDNNINKLIDLYEKDIENNLLRDKLLEISNAIDIYNDTLLEINNGTYIKNSEQKDLLKILLKKLYFIS